MLNNKNSHNIFSTYLINDFLQPKQCFKIQVDYIQAQDIEYNNMLLEYYNSYNDVSLHFEIMSDDNHSDIDDNNTEYSDTDSNLNEDELQDSEQ